MVKRRTRSAPVQVTSLRGVDGMLLVVPGLHADHINSRVQAGRGRLEAQVSQTRRGEQGSQL